eukprot:Nitzschia sp. Nitz4//scaffold68_size99682//51527//54845//NITZ4_004567-RA/size99682-snap-gene-0.2-mRNA-1//1//CDS//3329556602//9105//frame0
MADSNHPGESSTLEKDAGSANADASGNRSNRSSPVQGRTTPSMNGVRSHLSPVMTNSVPTHNRPPSTTSVLSTGSAGPRSTTATSRRGGRTRSRSPPMVQQRPPSSNAEPYAQDHGEPAPMSPANPSAAAAAAAAAAKSITRNPPPPPSSWYESSAHESRERDYRRSRGESSRYHGHYYEGGPPPPSSHRHNNWQEEEGPPSDRPPSRNRYPPSRRPPPQHDEHYSYRDGAYPPYRGRRGEPYPPHYEEDYERRYVDSRYEDRRGGAPPEPRPGYEYRGRDHRHPGNMRREDPYYSQSHPPHHPESDPSMKRTTRVIGTATPIHMPRAQEPNSRPSRSSSGSIFRGRPGSEMRNPEEDHPQKILMALRTPSTSFEEKQPKAAKRGDDPLSPDAPPQIQHSHHQSNTDSNLFFEPQRSPKSTTGPPQPSSSIDMAPSFTLFNQSFDSIGDTANFFNVSGPLDAALQSPSFGAGPSASDDKGTELHLSSSAGNFSQQLLGGSGSGALTFEMSPNNSFGNGPPTMRTGNMMVLGGQEHRSSSPTQVLDMYRSYSGGPGPSPRSNKGSTSMEESHARMNSHGAEPPVSNSYSRSFAEPPPGQYRSGPPYPETSDGSPGFYMFLKRHKGAFKDCTFLLPGLKAALLQTQEMKQEESAADTPKRHTRSGDPYAEPDPHDIAVALRRVESAVCAFGGTFAGDRTSQFSNKSSTNSQSIFREKPGEVSSNSNATDGQRPRKLSKYDELLPGRYYENDNRLSWELEENPPIEEPETSSRKNQDEEEYDDKSKDADGEKGEDDNAEETQDGNKDASGSKDDQPKMRYRCKLCGQPKQNHTCPYQQSLARSIGVMVYPAVNAFTASEPGVLAPPLSEMNNFVVTGAESVSSTEASPSRPTPDRLRRMNQGMPSGSAQVTPESLRGGSRGINSPVTTPQRVMTPSSSRHSGRRYMGGMTPGSVSSAHKKRTFGQMSDDQGDLLFVEATALKPEQFRIVTTSATVESPEAFTYRAIPLPYAQRKRLSDNLFSLSLEVPKLKDECAAVLREAREKDLWDLAVAELMTQVVVVVHCHDGDSRFEGLRRYLLTLGISC